MREELLRALQLKSRSNEASPINMQDYFFVNTACDLLYISITAQQM